ncbi:universal stress protein [Chitinophaga sp. Ak27]|uniref:universal stress protein n=1 Tax=Chitinophaga sp. Ak27 TaxID=2726116 RepID=UPI00145D6E62|nr:universal stress protein [Chitinophaga sp. Ak27]NLU90504.1 universal stress protein [Chitinophaga sp. Ak27]
METILVGTDFSRAAFNAACYAVDMALAMNKEVLLLNIYTIPVSYGEVPMMINEEELVQDMENELKKLKEQLLLRTNNKVPIKTLERIGMFFIELDTVCGQVKPYVVVLGSQGSTAAERLILGGHTVYAMKHLNWPLIAVPPGAHFSGVKKIGLACDFSHVAETVPANKIKAFTKDLHAELHILNIAKQQDKKPEIAGESEALHQMLASANPHYHYIVQQHTDQSIIDTAVTNGIDLLIVVPKHHDLLHVLTHKSHTSQLTMHAKIPLMALQ